MGWTAAAKIVANEALLSELGTGSGTAAIKVYTAADTLLHSFTVDIGASSVNGTTGVLTLTAGTATTSVATGTASYATLVSKDAVVLYDDMQVAEGTSAVSGSCVLSTFSFTSGGSATLVSAVIG